MPILTEGPGKEGGEMHDPTKAFLKRLVVQGRPTGQDIVGVYGTSGEIIKLMLQKNAVPRAPHARAYVQDTTLPFVPIVPHIRIINQLLAKRIERTSQGEDFSVENARETAKFEALFEAMQYTFVNETGITIPINIDMILFLASKHIPDALDSFEAETNIDYGNRQTSSKDDKTFVLFEQNSQETNVFVTRIKEGLIIIRELVTPDGERRVIIQHPDGTKRDISGITTPTKGRGTERDIFESTTPAEIDPNDVMLIEEELGSKKLKEVIKKTLNARGIIIYFNSQILDNYTKNPSLITLAGIECLSETEKAACLAILNR